MAGLDVEQLLNRVAQGEPPGTVFESPDVVRTALTVDALRRLAHQPGREMELAAVLPLIDGETLSGMVPILMESPSYPHIFP